MHVLIVEPDMHLAHAYKRVLELKGHSVEQAFTAQAALEKADLKTPDVISLELQLPGANGIAFLQELRTYEDWRSIPVVLHTYAMPLGQSALKIQLEEQFGVVSWLYKPQTSLLQLQTILENYGQRQA